MTDDRAMSPDDAATESAIVDDAGIGRRGKLGRLSIVITIVIAIIFGLFYAYNLFWAISNVVGVTTQINSYNVNRVKFGLEAVSTPWVVLIADVLISPVVYALAFFLGRRQTIFVKIVYFFLGLAVVAAVLLTLIALA
ncbi:hypothetical protein [Glaciihabitans sp. UYNi722]|uniref:hypothetical protein n=1 Tax=Glaciihabitans sp. UYNi722 TaxID=3156344 RepID=UPI0033940904